MITPGCHECHDHFHFQSGNSCLYLGGYPPLEVSREIITQLCKPVMGGDCVLVYIITANYTLPTLSGAGPLPGLISGLRAVLVIKFIMVFWRDGHNKLGRAENFHHTIGVCFLTRGTIHMYSIKLPRFAILEPGKQDSTRAIQIMIANYELFLAITFSCKSI